ncbi:DMT family transporter [Blochmannia endosymbiont of Polyrhachis (Hedomyrma) turneri]|uniref:DMT family transporter n=1 Tax=Blochmannia endosymbiont of Polyrhachis (Hedomyrma) turneri TaxID=1505596 RepID=UPI00061A76CC|nr:multidrug efflux SMR transporter [Blochmannia endosymbiont of Polyrhachis (Hedomyrma) turneri]AKC60109.1 quaternary ammonium compound-resistance protein qacE [Blochmannia endosymbiont of Polyrhachis (Hedomyrma) turneri]
MAYLYLLIAIIAEVIATTSLKASWGFSKIYPSIIVIIGYAISFILLSLALKTIPIGIAYAYWAGLGIIFITIIGYLVYKQTLDTFAIIGISLIIIGMLMINLLSKTIKY